MVPQKWREIPAPNLFHAGVPLILMRRKKQGDVREAKKEREEVEGVGVEER
jgi:hypothetical protein